MMLQSSSFCISCFSQYRSRDQYVPSFVRLQEVLGGDIKQVSNHILLIKAPWPHPKRRVVHLLWSQCNQPYVRNIRWRQRLENNLHNLFLKCSRTRARKEKSSYLFWLPSMNLATPTSLTTRRLVRGRFYNPSHFFTNLFSLIVRVGSKLASWGLSLRSSSRLVGFEFR